MLNQEEVIRIVRRLCELRSLLADRDRATVDEILDIIQKSHPTRRTNFYDDATGEVF